MTQTLRISRDISVAAPTTATAAEPDRLIAWSTVLTGHGRRRGQARVRVELAPEGVGTRFVWRSVPPTSPRLAVTRRLWAGPYGSSWPA